MELKEFNMQDLLLAAMKGEVEAMNVYRMTSEAVNNPFMKERMVFLAEEEKKHHSFIMGLFKQRFPDVEVILPDTSPVPMPVMKVPGPEVPMSDVFHSAMMAEKASSVFYNALGDLFEKGEVRNTLRYFASMEMAHYKILEDEKSVIENFEEFDTEWPMMHIGP